MRAENAVTEMMRLSSEGPLSDEFLTVCLSPHPTLTPTFASASCCLFARWDDTASIREPPVARNIEGGRSGPAAGAQVIRCR